MSDLISHQVLSKLGIVCFEYHSDGFFSCVGQAPQWAIELFPCVRNRFPKILPGDISPFLENFIIDAIDFWQQDSDSILRSGYWSETIPDGIQSAEFEGHDIHLEALVLKIEHTPIMLLEVSEMKFFETFHWLQTARKERLDSTLEQKSNATQVMSTAFFDPLTGMPNERSFSLQLSQWLEAFRQGQKDSFLIIKLNIDRFRALNITLGNARGDQYLIQLAQRLKQFSGADNLLARCDADEFLLAINKAGQPHWNDVIERLESILHSPYKLGKKTIFTTACLGMINCDSDQQSAEELIGNLSIALNQAKSIGRGQYCFFNQDFKNEKIQKLSVEQELLRAIHQKDLTCKLQPTYEFEENQVNGVRLLWEWHHPQLENWHESALRSLVHEYELPQLFQHCCLDLASSLHEVLKEGSPANICFKVDFKVLFSQAFLNKLLDFNKSVSSSSRLTLMIEKADPSPNPDQSTFLEKLNEAGINLCISLSEFKKISPLNLWASSIAQIAIPASLLESKSRAEEVLAELETLGMNSHNWTIMIEEASSKLNEKAIAALPIETIYGDYFSKPLSVDDFEAFLRSQKAAQKKSSTKSKKKSSVD